MRNRSAEAVRGTAEQEVFVGKRVAKEMTAEEFEDWCNAQKKLDEIGQAADEVGGPRLSLVPVPEQNAAWPTDLLPPAAQDDEPPEFRSNLPASGSPAGARIASGCS